MEPPRETAPDPLLLTSSIDNGCTLRLRGEIDVTNVGSIEAVLRQLTGEHPPELVLDLQEVTFLDSAGIRLILQVDRWQKQAGNSLTVVPGAGVVQRVFEVSGLGLILQIDRAAG